MTPTHKKLLAQARKKVREAQTDLTIAEFDVDQARGELEDAKHALALLKRVGGKRRCRA